MTVVVLCWGEGGLTCISFCRRSSASVDAEGKRSVHRCARKRWRTKTWRQAHSTVPLSTHNG